MKEKLPTKTSNLQERILVMLHHIQIQHLYFILALFAMKVNTFLKIMKMHIDVSLIQ